MHYTKTKILIWKGAGCCWQLISCKYSALYVILIGTYTLFEESGVAHSESDPLDKAKQRRRKLNLRLSAKVIKHTFEHVRPAKIQIRLRIRAVWSESSLGTLTIAKDAQFAQADKDNSDQTAWMHRLIWVIVGRTCSKVHFQTLRLFSFSSMISDSCWYIFKTYRICPKYWAP